jgi:hypothetical protein
MPGSNPPSAAPNSALTATNPAKFCIKPKHMAMIPHAQVKADSHIRGVILFKTRLLGTSLHVNWLANAILRQRLLLLPYLTIYVA